jgi:TolB-like protein/Tfp pilus assembly protein PilF
VSFFNELKRRNVFRVAAAYIIVAWLLLQVSDTLVPALHLPEWFHSGVAFLLILGFPIAMIFAWAFEMTPDGLKKERDVDRSQSVTTVTGKKLNHTITVVLVLALGYFIFDKFVLDPGRDASEIATAVQAERQKVSDSPEAQQIDKSIAVLPFVNMSSDQEQEYFSDGLSEELLNLLAKIPELHVAARTSSFSFKGQNIEIPVIASRLKVAHVLEGSVRKSGDQIRITAQLIQADNGYHLWSETYDRKLDNIFQIQDEIAAAVVDALKITLLGEAPRARETNPETYQLFLEGQFLRRQVSASTMPRAIGLFKEALEIDPAYAPAWAELAYAYMWNAGLSGMPIEEGNLLADQAITRALESDPDYAWAYFVRGVAKIFNKFDFKAGAEDYQLALQLDPGNAYLIGSNATSARVLGRFDESIQLSKKALELDPLMAEMRSWQGLTYQYAGQLDQAETAYRTTLTLSPEFSGGHYRLGRVLLRKGRTTEALAEMEQVTSRVYNNTGLAMAHHVLGNHEESQSALDYLIKNKASSAAFQIAEVYGYRDEPAQAFEWLEQSLVIRDSGLAGILGNPAFLGLRADPRWQPFLEKLGLLEFWLEMPVEHGGPLQ